MGKFDSQKVKVPKVEKPLQRLNKAFNGILDELGGASAKRQRELDELATQVEDIVHDDLQNLSKFTGDDISQFLSQLFNERNGQDYAATSPKSVEDIFADESSSGIFNFFQDRYKNQNLLYEDLNVICSQLFELKEAMNTTRDAIVTSDDTTVNVSHTLNFKNHDGDEKDRKGLIDTITNMQKRYELLEKLKNHIIPNTLQYGRYYVYVIPEAKLFEEHEKKILKNKQRISAAMESVDDTFAKSFLSSMNKDDTKGIATVDVKSNFNTILEGIEVVNEDYSIPLVEGTDTSALFDEDFRKYAGKIVKKADKELTATPTFSEAVSDGKSKGKKSDKKLGDYTNIEGCHIKLIDPRKMIPVKILDQTIGYYYVHQAPKTVARSPFTQTIRSNMATSTPKDLETKFLSNITDKIVKSFNKEYLENNLKFKELILNALIYNDVYKKDIKFQFIPVDYVQEFHVNKNEEGEGQSIIMPALFHAKLYLALLIFKMIMIITRSADTKVYYVKQSGLDQNVSNKVQEIARNIKERQINFMDLLNYNSMISKIGQARDIFMPIGRSGDKGIDFDVLAGQDIQLNTELMEMLRTSYISSTGVPSVIMNYINEADYSKTLVMANDKFVGRVVSYQIDFNRDMTSLYKKMMAFTTSLDPDIIDEFEFSLNAPKALNVTNTGDLISNADVVINAMIKSMTGDQANQSEEDNLVKDMLYRRLAQDFLPMLPWGRATDIYESVMVDVKKELDRRKSTAQDQE